MPDARSAALEIVAALRSAGHESYLAGGCVRDELLGLKPDDYDVATAARPDSVRSLFRSVSEVGVSFGVMLVRQRGHVVEVATFREEGAYTDARRPDQVRFSTAEADARRRDFTVNALFLDPLDDSAPPPGRVIDFVGGLPDLGRRLIRAVGAPDDRLAEDHLRALRAVRLASRLGFEIDPDTNAAIERHSSELRGVSRERIGDEARKMLGHRSRAVAAARLQELGLDAPTLDEPPTRAPLTALHGLPADASFSTALAAWSLDRLAARDGGPHADVSLLAPRLRRALCLSNDESAALRAVMEGVATLEGRWAAMGVAAQKRAAASDWFEPALSIVSARSFPAAEAVRARRSELAALGPGIAPAALLTGDDLIGAGLAPGPSFKRTLDAVYDAQLEGRVAGRDEALALALRLAAEASPRNPEGPASV